MDYSCIKCIVEYLEANKRFRLSSRCPAIRKIERSIPLHLELLDITSNTIRINDFRFTPEKEEVTHEEVVLPGDIVLQNQRTREVCNYFYRVLWIDDRENPREWFRDEVLKRFPEGVRIHYAMRWLGNFLFEGRSEITTRKLEIIDANVLRLPADFKIKKVGILKTFMGYLDPISKFVNPMVETIIIFYYNRQTIHDHPLIRAAKKIHIQFEVRISDLLDFTHKNIEYGRTLSKEDFEILIRKWITDGREIGTSFTFFLNHKDYELNSLKNFETMFDGRTVYYKGQTEHLTTQDIYSRLKVLQETHGTNEGRNVLYCICLPMNSTSELQISLSRGDEGTWSKIVLEVVPFESWPTLTTPKSDHVNKKSKKDKCKVS